MTKKAVSKIAKGRYAKAVVFRGTKAKTYNGLTKSDLLKIKCGRLMTKKQQSKGMQLYSTCGKQWIASVQKTRNALGVRGFFLAIKKGSPLYNKVKEFDQ